MCKGQCLLVVLLFLELAHSWDIVISAADQLDFYTHDGISCGSVRLEYQKPTALAYDEIHNVVLYVNKWSVNNAICGYKISSKIHECYIENNGRNIQGLAFDPVTELLFFTDIMERSIIWFSFKPGFKNNIFGNLLIKIDNGTPTDIAVDSCRGYIYWINKKVTMSTIERARFNGSEREVVINTHGFDLNSLIICQQTQKIYFVNKDFYRADLNGQNQELLDVAKYAYIPPFGYPSTLTASKGFLFYVDRCMYCNPKNVWKFIKPIQRNIRNYKRIFSIPNHLAFSVGGIAANYKIKDEIQGISGCNEVPNHSEINVFESVESPFCDHGVKINGQSLCKCTPGYIGVRCDVTVCENYCIQGSCSLNDEGLPKCRCNAGYSGERCEVNKCYRYCSNNGICSLNDKSEPVCQCKGDYFGDRCKSSVCENYCFQGNCSINEERIPKCRCNAGYSGERCEVNKCLGYCSNNGICSFNEKSEPVCQCKGDYLGDRCESSVCENYCFQGNCSINEEELPICRCNAGYSGERCEVNECHGYCSNNGICSFNEKSEPVCQCKGDYLGDRCESSVCENYCFQGKCSINEEELPMCRCNAGYSGQRCEVNECHGYCSNNGICSLNDTSEPVCECKDDYFGNRCEKSVCENYCFQGNCSIDEEGLPICRCDAGYSGHKCEMNMCQGYCLNNGTCSLNEEDEPVCQCKEDYFGDRCEISICENYYFQDCGFPRCR